uniref:Uncharacterized protein n=1 Tax=Trypanosoma congolense (strain IL3000) TaxID=1068625 RepID=G0UR36_TRYCI|nr:hypothetical protein TCIL3000_8_530 [Trypanosoma congolense IL3000]
MSCLNVSLASFRDSAVTSSAAAVHAFAARIPQLHDADVFAPVITSSSTRRCSSLDAVRFPTKPETPAYASCALSAAAVTSASTACARSASSFALAFFPAAATTRFTVSVLRAFTAAATVAQCVAWPSSFFTEFKSPRNCSASPQNAFTCFNVSFLFSLLFCF